MTASGFFAALSRKKRRYDDSSTQLARVLTLANLVSLGVGSTLGLGVYVLAGSVAKTSAGPATCLSFVAAAIVSLFSGLCNAEFAGRVPRAGYTYIYSYVSIGEFVAFIIGWNLILGCILSSASVASAMSKYIDVLTNNSIQHTLTDWMPMDVQYLSKYPNLLALGILISLTIILSIGFKNSAAINSVSTFLNAVTICTMVVGCYIKADSDNWKVSPENVDETYRSAAGEGGFLPFGIAGIIAGTPQCFFGLGGFDTPANCSEEAKNPKRDIPLAILISLCIVFLAYFALSTSLTLAWPYYLQDTEAPFAYVFDQLGWPTMKWIVTIGAVFALLSCMFGSMYVSPRIIYAMSNDGLLFEFLAKVHPKTKIPLAATVLSGLSSGLLATFMDLSQIIDLITIGGLLSAGIIAPLVLLLRYEKNENSTKGNIQNGDIEVKKICYKDMFNLKQISLPSTITSRVANITILCFCTVSITLNIVLVHGSKILSPIIYYILVSIILLILVILMIILSRQPQSDRELTFKVPLVPLIPCLSVIFHTHLMMNLGAFTWVGFIVWILIGCILYFSYGISHSKENDSENKELKK
ncbi:unnamed protein product [Phaedon cochleariae]|uniref:Cationic amino acid transporter C-terminal domain-containing protein n=1 Tax=Phaedon cochleariae TaxID=80249 RepID=A0A9P0DU48_PHACE|nr:unnamed protein product [Phaedon cochleariae]